MILNLERMQNIIDQFNAQRFAKIGKRLELMNGFITKYTNFRETTFGQPSTTFNIFNVLNVRNDELKHSAMVAWLLDVRGNHNQGNLFFNTFLQSCNIDLPLDGLSRYDVRRELSGMEAIIDISVFRRREFLLYIENKVSSEEGIEQCTRELRDMYRLGVRLDIPQEKQFAIFLTPDGRDPISGDPTKWITLSYQQLGNSFGQLTTEITSDKVRFVLNDWLEVISIFGRE